MRIIWRCALHLAAQYTSIGYDVTLEFLDGVTSARRWRAHEVKFYSSTSCDNEDIHVVEVEAPGGCAFSYSAYVAAHTIDNDEKTFFLAPFYPNACRSLDDSGSWASGVECDEVDVPTC